MTAEPRIWQVTSPVPWWVNEPGLDPTPPPPKPVTTRIQPPPGSIEDWWWPEPTDATGTIELLPTHRHRKLLPYAAAATLTGGAATAAWLLITR